MQSFAHVGIRTAGHLQQSASQCVCHGGHRRLVRQNRASVQDETEIINEWNKTLQVFDVTDPSFILHLRVSDWLFFDQQQYVILSISRLAMLGQPVNDSDEGIYGQCCYMCGRKFDCLHKPIVCNFCRFMFCTNCAPRTLVLGVNNVSKRVCVLCEHMYKFVNKKDEKQYSWTPLLTNMPLKWLADVSIFVCFDHIALLETLRIKNNRRANRKTLDLNSTLLSLLHTFYFAFKMTHRI